jgi:hypothetical protein
MAARTLVVNQSDALSMVEIEKNTNLDGYWPVSADARRHRSQRAIGMPAISESHDPAAVDRWRHSRMVSHARRLPERDLRYLGTYSPLSRRAVRPTETPSAAGAPPAAIFLQS